MPLIDDNTRVTDRRPSARWPWVVVIAGLAVMWLAIAGVVSFLPHFESTKTPPTPAAVVQQFNQQQLQQAQRMSSFGQWEEAAAAIRTVDASLPMSDSDKHQYFRVGAQAMIRTGSPLAGARFYERFLSLGVRIHEKDCKACHNSRGQIAPLKLADLRTSTLGSAYTRALRKAGRLEAKRRELQAELKTKDDPRLHLLLYHIEIARHDNRSAAIHAEAIRKWATRQILNAK